MARARRVATEAERALWSSVVRDVRPLDGASEWRPEPLPEPETAPPPAPADVAVPVRRESPGPGPVDRGTLARLKKGQVEIDARIDLHGMDQRAAFGALMGFVDMSLKNGRRTLLVITGKGPAGGGVLRRGAPEWLRSSPFGPRILAISSAHARHGGDGAFYVMLRRNRINRER